MKKDLYFGGVPTDLDVKKIREVYPEHQMRIGQVIPYSQIVAIIGANYGTSRFFSVTNAWRKKVESETSIILSAQEGTHFRVLSETEKVDLSASKLVSAAKHARRSFVIANRIDVKQISQEDKQRLDHQVNVSSKIIASSKLRKAPELPQI
jgi:hypothetical protein